MVPNPYNPQDWDRYAYVRNNPVINTDPTGNKTRELVCPGESINSDELADSIQSDPDITRYWEGLSKEEKQALGNASWDKGSFNDFVKGGNAKSADLWHDPLTYLELAVGGGGLIKTGAGLLSGATTVGGAEVARVGITVLGRYPAYLNVARDLSGNALNNPGMNEMTTEEVWIVNQAFLDDAVARGDYFYLASNWAKAEAGSFFARELDYLFKVHNYTIAPGRPWLIPPD